MDLIEVSELSKIIEWAIYWARSWLCQYAFCLLINSSLSLLLNVEIEGYFHSLKEYLYPRPSGTEWLNHHPINSTILHFNLMRTRSKPTIHIQFNTFEYWHRMLASMATWYSSLHQAGHHLSQFSVLRVRVRVALSKSLRHWSTASIVYLYYIGTSSHMIIAVSWITWNI